MKNLIEKTVNGLPYLVLAVLFMVIIMFVYDYGVSYYELVGLIEVLIWPAIILSALIFFRKVFTYMFFSMEEFNFFGNKGRLKNIQEIIEERAQQRVDEEKKVKETQSMNEKFENELKTAKNSGPQNDNAKVERLRIVAEKVFLKYKEALIESSKLTSELLVFRREKIERQARIAAMRERVSRRREEEEAGQRQINEPSDQEIDRAADDASEEYHRRKITRY